MSNVTIIPNFSPERICPPCFDVGTEYLVQWTEPSLGVYESHINATRSSQARALAYVRKGTEHIVTASLEFGKDDSENILSFGAIDSRVYVLEPLNEERIKKIFINTLDGRLAKRGIKGVIDIRAVVEIWYGHNEAENSDFQCRPDILILDLTNLGKFAGGVDLSEYPVYIDAIGIKNIPIILVTGRFENPPVVLNEASPWH